MNMHGTRKVTCKKVQLCATVRDCNLLTSQGTMCRKEIYNASLQDFANFLKISVVATYNLSDELLKYGIIDEVITDITTII